MSRLAIHYQKYDYGRRNRAVLVEHVNEDCSWSIDPLKPDRYIVLEPQPHWENVSQEAVRLDAVEDVTLFVHEGC